jgi:hypothetical protein
MTLRRSGRVKDVARAWRGFALICAQGYAGALPLGLRVRAMWSAPAHAVAGRASANCGFEFDDPNCSIGIRIPDYPRAGPSSASRA